MDRLADCKELLDGPLDDPVALAAHLRDLTWINRWLGGIRLSQRALDALVGSRVGPLTLLDIGTGAADIPAALQALEAQHGRDLRVIALDSRPEVVSAALAVCPELASRAGLPILVEEGRWLSKAAGTTEIAHAPLV